jgi:uncharacterized protein YndB with AHSA1/START domain
MTCQVEAFDAQEGGSFRLSLTHDAPSVGMTAARTHTYQGRFAKLVPDEQVVEVIEFETADPALRGQQRITTTLRDVEGGTEVIVEHEGVPPGVSVEDNELGMRMSLAKLAQLVEIGGTR